MYVDTQQPSAPAAISLDSLIAWLEKQDPKNGYDLGDMGGCALTQWAKSIDPDSYPISRYAYTYCISGAAHNLVRFHQVVAGSFGPKDWTFGKALKRALAERC